MIAPNYCYRFRDPSGRLGPAMTAEELKMHLCESLLLRYAEPESGHWVTIGGHEEGRAKHRDGTSVFIGGDGNIEKGPDALVGKPVPTGDKGKPKSKKSDLGNVDEFVLGEKPAEFASDMPPEKPIEKKEIPAELAGDPVWKELRVQAAGLNVDMSAKVAINNAVVDFMVSQRSDADVSALEQALESLGVGKSFDVPAAVALGKDQAERQTFINTVRDIIVDTIKEGDESNSELSAQLRGYLGGVAWEDAKHNYIASGGIQNLLESFKYMGDDISDVANQAVNTALQYHGQEPKGILAWGGQFQLPGFGGLASLSPGYKHSEYQYSTDSIAKLEGFIKNNLPNGAHVIENSGWTDDKHSIQGWDTFTTPSGEQFSLTDEANKLTHEYTGSADTFGVDMKLLDSIPRKMGWDEFTTALWHELRNDADMNDAVTTEESQQAENDAQAEQEAEQGSEDEFADYDAMHVPEPSTPETIGLDHDDDGIDDYHVGEVQQFVTDKVGSMFSNGPGWDSDADEFWKYANGNYGSLNKNLRHITDPTQIQDNKESHHLAIDNIIEQIGVWPKPAMVYRGVYGEYATKLVAAAEKALKEGKTFSENVYSHTSFDPAFALTSAGTSGTLLIIKSKTGFWGAPYTQYANENEVFKKPLTEYRPIKVYHKELKHPQLSGTKYNPTIILAEEVLPEELEQEHGS